MIKIRERTLKIVLNDHISDFETIIWNINDITSDHRNIQTLLTELFQIKYDLAPPIMDSILNRSTICYIFETLQEFYTERKRIAFLWSRDNKLTRAPIMDTFAGRVWTKKHKGSFLKVVSDNGYATSVSVDSANYLYQT